MLKIVMLKKGRKHFLDSSLNLPGSFLAETHLSSKLRGNWFCGFCVILLANQQTNQQTEKHNLLGDKIKKIVLKKIR